LRPVRVEPCDRAPGQLLVAAAPRQDGDFGAFVVVFGRRLRDEATDHNAATAIGRNRQILATARNFENPPAAVVKNRSRRMLDRSRLDDAA
jgi:hypothetical protein